jgi:lysophospholipase L1-like esterase
MANHEVSLAKPESEFRIAFLGDSVTANFLIIPESQSYVTALRSQLERELEPPLRVDTLNFAVNGYSLLQSARMLEARALRFEPDLVIFQLCLNDPYPTPSAYTDLGPEPLSRLRNFIERRLAPDRFWGSAFVSANYDAQGIENVRRGLLRVAEATRGGPRVLAVLFPYLYARAYSQWDFVRHHAVYREAAEQAGLKLLDLYPAFRDAGLLNAKPYPADALHPGPDGHAFAAAQIRAELERLGYLPTAQARSTRAPRGAGAGSTSRRGTRRRGSPRTSPCLRSGCARSAWRAFAASRRRTR